MASDTNTKKTNSAPFSSKESNRPWFRIKPNPDLKDDLMRLYWGRTEPRITALTLKIMGMNVIALVMLLVGVLYLGQYQTELIDAKLETFNAKTELIAAAISESATLPPQNLSLIHI